MLSNSSLVVYFFQIEKKLLFGRFLVLLIYHIHCQFVSSRNKIFAVALQYHL